MKPGPSSRHDRDNAADKMADVPSLTPIVTSHALGAIDQNGQGAEFVSSSDANSFRVASGMKEHLDAGQWSSGQDGGIKAANGDAAWLSSGNQPNSNVDTRPLASHTSSLEEVRI